MVENSPQEIKKLLKSSKAFFALHKLNAEHLDDCISIEHSINKHTSQRSQQDIKQFLKHYSCFGVFCQDFLLGFAVIKAVKDEAELIDITVPKYAQKHGIGHFLLKKVCKKLKNKNVDDLILEVAENNKPALKLYNKFDAERIGIRKNYYTTSNKSKIDAFVYKINL
jgi:ribosomal-protein-alanine acetyltransferase